MFKVHAGHLIAHVEVHAFDGVNKQLRPRSRLYVVNDRIGAPIAWYVWLTLKGLKVFDFGFTGMSDAIISVRKSLKEDAIRRADAIKLFTVFG